MSSVPPQDSIAWWQSPTLRAVAVTMAPVVVLGLNALHVKASLSDAVDLIVAIIGGIGGVVIILRRIRAGADPASPAQPIKMRII